MQPTDEQIKEVAEELQNGMNCYVHRKTARIVSFPDPIHFSETDDEFWPVAHAEVEAHPDDYLEIDPMSSRRSFQVMEEFANALPDEKYKNRLFDILSLAKPFRHLTPRDVNEWRTRPLEAVYPFVFLDCIH